MYWSVLPFPFNFISLWMQGAWSAKKNPGQWIVLPEPPKVRRSRNTRKQRRLKN
jgi:hypothetical protein